MKKKQFDNPPTRLRRTSPKRQKDFINTPLPRFAVLSPQGGQDNGGQFTINKHHQHRSKNMRNLARTLRKNQTSQERKLWWHLCRANLGFKFRRQYLIDDKYIADFVCLERKVIIEIDGSQHADNAQDAKRTDYLQAQGFKVIRFWNCDILQKISACVEVIRQACLKQ